MTAESVLVLVGIAVVCGVVGQMLAGYSVGNFLVSTGVGLVGAILGMWLADAFDLPVFYPVRVGGEEFPVIWSVAGSAILVAILGVLAGNRRW